MWQERILCTLTALLKTKKMAIEVHNAAAPVADSAVSGLPSGGFRKRSDRPARQQTAHVAVRGKKLWVVAVVAGEMKEMVICRSRG